MKGVLKYKLDARYNGEPGFVQSNHNKVTKNHITSEMEEQVLHLVED